MSGDGEPNITVTVRCADCGHEQQATSAVAFRRPDGAVSYYFGSAYRYCSECDGPTVELPPA